MGGLLLSLPFLIGALLTPFVGLIIDKIGLKSIFIIFCDVFFLIAHLILAFLPQI